MIHIWTQGTLENIHSSYSLPNILNHPCCLLRSDLFCQQVNSLSYWLSSCFILHHILLWCCSMTCIMGRFSPSIQLTSSVALMIALKCNLLTWYPFVLSLKILQKWALESQTASFHLWNGFSTNTPLSTPGKTYRTYSRQHLHTQNNKGHLVQITLAILMRKISFGVCHLFLYQLLLRKWWIITNIQFFS